MRAARIACVGSRSRRSGDNNNLPHNPTLGAAKRAMTTSFGSIALGSLIVAVIQTVRALLRSLARQRGDNIAIQIVVCLVDCILGCIERLFRYFSKYVYVQCAIYGKSFCEAARDTWRLVGSHGIQAIINDSFIGAVLAMAQLCIALVCFCVGALAGVALTESDVNTANAGYEWLVYGILGALIGFVVASTTVSVVDSGVSTLFVSYAMDPEALEHNDRELKARFDETASNGHQRRGSLTH